MKFFNTAGPIAPEDHYYIPHKSGKTTAITMFARQLNAEEKYKALYFNVEPAQAARSNVEMAMKIILMEIRNWGHNLLQANDPLFFCIETGLKEISGSSLGSFLRDWSASSDKPIVLFIDEIDSLVGDTLISVLRQLRAQYPARPRNFPQAVCLVGVRDVCDYRIWSDEKQAIVLGGSAFNIKAKSLVMPNFSLEQVRDLYLQHTQETGQQFTDEAIEYAFDQTQGQPWLVNALAYQACFEDVTDYTQPITQKVIERAKETLIAQRDTHIDVLVDRLQESRVRAIMDAIVSGGTIPKRMSQDDLSYVIDLGLVTKREKRLEIANPIYQEIIPIELTANADLSIENEIRWYQNKDKSLNMIKLLDAFTQFYREHSAIWFEDFDYKESGPHLLLMAFLQRLINGGGKIHREYALARKRVDLLIEWPVGKSSQAQRIVIELKINYSKKTLEEGLKQTAQYMDINNATQGHLIIFDRTEGKDWSEKIFNKTVTQGKLVINVWGM